LPSDAVQEQLERIQSSQTFSRSDRHRRFLTYLVQGVLQGRSHELTEGRAAVEVFNRKASFDPNVDPIVRVEAGRLRRRLRDYYEGEGTGDPVVVDLPSRSYIPIFQKRTATDPPADPPAADPPPPRRWTRTVVAAVAPVFFGLAVFFGANLVSNSRTAGGTAFARPAIVVLPFLDLTPRKSQDLLCDLLAEELIDHAARIAGLRVVSRMSSLQYRGKPADVREIGRSLNAQLAVEGTIREDGDMLLIAVDLVSTDDGYHLWSRTYARKLGDTAAVHHQMAKDMTAVLRRRVGSAR
jgi:TolB-like protein